MKPELARGVKDTNPEEQILKDSILSTIKYKFERYGFSPLQTPVIEREETLTSKYAGGEEILKEIYTFKDQGDRNLALRFDLTVPLARYIALNPTLKKPFKRYQIGNVFRDGPVKSGRYREFIQCDADVVGTKSVYSEAELLKIASEVFKELGLEVTIQINDRKLLNAILDKAKIEDQESFILTLDKIEKIGREGVEKELREKKFPDNSIKTALDLAEKNLEDLKGELEESALKDLKNLFLYLDSLDVKYEHVTTLARGLAYYTGTVYEVFAKDNKVKSSLAAGGRYDEMITKYSNKDNPAVGLSFGLEAIAEAISKEPKPCNTKLYVIPISNFKESLKIIENLRSKGINTDVALPKKDLKKALTYASKYRIPYALIIGEKELNSDKYTLRDMESGEESSLTIEEIVDKLI